MQVDARGQDLHLDPEYRVSSTFEASQLTYIAKIIPKGKCHIFFSYKKKKKKKKKEKEKKKKKKKKEKKKKKKKKE